MSGFLPCFCFILFICRRIELDYAELNSCRDDRRSLLECSANIFDLVLLPDRLLCYSGPPKQSGFRRRSFLCLRMSTMLFLKYSSRIFSLPALLIIIYLHVKVAFNCGFRNLDAVDPCLIKEKLGDKELPGRRCIANLLLESCSASREGRFAEFSISERYTTSFPTIATMGPSFWEFAAEKTNLQSCKC